MIFIFGQSFAQELPTQEVKSKVNEATVFIKDAQVVRNKTIAVKKGKSILKFVGLSPFIKKKSIQIKADGIMILSVNHQHNYDIKKKIDAKAQAIVDKKKAIDEELRLLAVRSDIVLEQIDFIKENKHVGGKNETTKAANFIALTDFYGKKYAQLKTELADIINKISKLREKRKKLDKRLTAVYDEKEYPTGEILVKIDSKVRRNAKFKLSYVVQNAGWYPSYDVRAKDINTPVNLIYKANVKQDTKVDWNNVKLTLSSSNPNLSGVAPKLETYFIDYNSRPPVYGSSFNEVSGVVTDAIDGSPLAGANIMIKGTTIGTATDFDGRYTLTIPSKQAQLVFSNIGYNTQTRYANRSIINVALKEGQQLLENVVVTAYSGNSDDNAINDEGEGVLVESTGYHSYAVKTKEMTSKRFDKKAIPFKQVNNQTTVSFNINTPYTIKSDNKNYSVEMADYQLPADYQYYCVPKIDEDAFLLANITNWEKYNLLEGEANIFFENTYIGKTLLNVRSASDTLQISLGRDKNISVSREKMKDFTSKQFIGNKKEETRAYKITVKNNKSQAINMLVFDQIPVSTLKEIKIETLEISKAKYDKESGELKWKFTLAPSKKKSFELRYSVKYPKYRSLIIE
jgi:hypothetical protein